MVTQGSTPRPKTSTHHTHPRSLFPVPHLRTPLPNQPLPLDFKWNLIYKKTVNHIKLTPQIREEAFKTIPKGKNKNHFFLMGYLGEYAFQGMAHGVFKEPNPNYDYNWQGLGVEVKTTEATFPETLEYVYLDQRGYNQNCDIYAFMAITPTWDACFALGCTLSYTFRKYAHKTSYNNYKFPASALVPL